MQDIKKQVILMKGIGVSSGIAIGRAHLLERGNVEMAHYCYLDGGHADTEIERFKEALRVSREQLVRIKTKMEEDRRGKDHIRIIDAHLLMLKDQMIVNDTIRIIKDERVNAEWALKTVMKDLMDYFNKIDDEYLRERSSDIEHILNRVLKNMMGKMHEGIPDLKTPSIVIARDLAPTDTAQMVKGTVLGFLTDVGGRTSHTAIMGRSLEIPAIVGLESISRKAENGDTVIVDGTTGTVIINPSESVIEVYKKRRERYDNYARQLLLYRELPCETTDGRRVRLMGNMEIVEEIDSLIEHGAEGIGLYRTEFLYLNRKDMPTEEEHVKAYRQIARKMAPNPVVVRTLDVGGDKILNENGQEREINPALGLRAIRYCLKNMDVFKVQLRGILRASSNGKIKIMFPMISGMEELRRAKELLEEAKAELKAEGKAFDHKIEVGAMIEVPSAAIITDLIVQEVDFVSIGTNDLLQYTLAIDRVNEHVAYLYEPYHPAVLRLIKTVVDAANKAGVSVSVCGEMASEPECVLIFLGMGLTNLSMNAFSVLRVKRLIRSVSYAEAKKITKAVLAFSTAREVEGYLSAKFPDFNNELVRN